MANVFKKIWKGLNIRPESTSSAASQGDIEVSSVTGKASYHDGSTLSPVVTETQASQGANQLKNKDLEDTSTAVVDTSDSTKKIKFDAAGTTGTSTTLLSSQTTNKTLTLPDATDTLVGKATTDVLTNKTLSGNTASNLVNSTGTFNFNSSGTITAPNATDTLVGKATTDILTNKTLSGNTASNLVNGSGTLNINSTGTITVPNATDTLVGKATTDTLTNKSISGSTNTITNVSLTTGITGTLPIANGGTNGITATAGFDNLAPTTTRGDLITRNASNNIRLAIGSAARVLRSDGTDPSWSQVVLTTDVSGTLPIGNGGTGQTTQTAAFNALDPLTTKGDIIVNNGTDSVRLPVGTNGQVLTANSAVTNGVDWETPSSSGSTNQSFDLTNLGLAASVATNAMTVALKGQNGSDPSGGNIVNISLRNSTATTGTYTSRSVSAALSVVIPSGATLGSTNGNPNYVFVYAIDNAGTVELAVTGSRVSDEGSLISTTAISAGSSSAYVFYSTTARSNVAFRLIGRVKSTQTTAGTWASSPSEISIMPFLENLKYSWLGNHDNSVDTWNFTSSGAFSNPASQSHNGNDVSESDNQNFGTVTSYVNGSAKYPGIVFTPPVPGRYFISAIFYAFTNTSGLGYAVHLNDITNTVIIAEGSNGNGADTSINTITLQGIWVAPASVSTTIALQVRNDRSGTTSFSVVGGNSGNTGVRMVNWTIFKLP